MFDNEKNGPGDNVTLSHTEMSFVVVQMVGGVSGFVMYAHGVEGLFDYFKFSLPLIVLNRC